MPLFFLLRNCLQRIEKGACWALFLFLTIVFIGGSAQAAESLVWKVLSQYHSPVPMQPESEVKWLYEQRVDNNITTIAVSDYDHRLQCRAELRYNESGSLVWVNSCRIIRDKEVCRVKNYEPQKPALLNQTLIPGDCLNLKPQNLVDGDWEEYTQVRESVGAASFIDYLTVKKESVTFEQAQAIGMLNQKNEHFAKTENLYTLSLLRGEKSQSELVLRQLWATGAHFWLYEEKDGRRSWYLGE